MSFNAKLVRFKIRTFLNDAVDNLGQENIEVESKKCHRSNVHVFFNWMVLFSPETE